MNLPRTLLSPLLLVSILVRCTHAWIVSPITAPRCTTSLSSATTSDEYEYVEYDSLRETDFAGSEWLVGTNWDRNPEQIDETWCRLAVNAQGQNVAVWGDGAEGTWNLDAASQFLSVSKESIFGKQIWAGVVDDYYYVQGTVRGWSYLQPASVLAQWQGKRLGVEPEEAGTAPWFDGSDDSDE